MAEHIHRWQLSTGVTPVHGACACGAERDFDNRLVSKSTMGHFAKPKSWQWPKARVSGYWTWGDK